MEKVIDQNRAYRIALFVVLLWSTVGTAIKFALQHSTYIEVVLLASLSSTFFLLLICIVNREDKSVHLTSSIKPTLSSILSTFKQSPIFYMLSGFLNPILYYLVLFAAYDKLPAQIAQPINYTWAIVLSLLSVPFLKQKLTLGDIAGLLICYFGVVILVTGLDFTTGLLFDTFGVFLAILSTFVWAIYWIVNIRNSANPIHSVFLNFVCAIPWLIGLFIYFWQELTFHPQTISASIYIGAAEMSIAFVLWLKALQLSKSAAQISVLIYLSPFISLVLFNLLLGEQIYPTTLLALIVIVVGLLLQKKLNDRITQETA